MKTNMAWTAVVRTLVQGGIGMFLASQWGMQIADTLATLGVPLNTDTLVNIATLFIIGVIVLIVNSLGPKFAWINRIISLGMSRTGPAYVPNDSDAVVSVANATTDDTITSVDTPPPGPDDAGPGGFDPGYNPGDPGYGDNRNI